MVVEVIGSQLELEEVEPFFVEELLWGTKSIPKTYGYLGFVPKEGFYLKMVCEEDEPLRTYENVLDPVYRDSAMEAFFQFEHENGGRRITPYLNFEVNAVIYDQDTTEELEKAFLKDIGQSKEITRELYAQRSLIVRVKEQVSRLLSPLL